MRERITQEGHIRKVIAKTRPVSEMERAVLNFEQHWRAGNPLNEIRIREGLPIVTKEQLAAKRDKAFGKKP